MSAAAAADPGVIRRDLPPSMVGLRPGIDATSAQLETWRRVLADDLGPVVYGHLMDANVGDIYLNGNGYVCLRKHGVEGFAVSQKRLSPDDRRKIAQAILAIHDIRDVPNKATFNVELPFDGSRCAIQSPMTADGWEIILRKRTMKRYSPLALVESGMITREEIEDLARAIAARETILISGGTGAGKTVFMQTLLDVLIRQIHPDENTFRQRLIIIEHVQELLVDYPQVSRWRTDYGVPMIELVHQALRADPDRIISGEQRDGSTLQYFRGISTGHPGAMFTVHANSAQHAPQRCVDLVQEGSSSNVDARRLTLDAVQRVVHVHRFQNGSRRVQSHRLVGANKDGTFKTVPAVVPKSAPLISYGGPHANQ